MSLSLDQSAARLKAIRTGDVAAIRAWVQDAEVCHSELSRIAFTHLLNVIDALTTNVVPMAYLMVMQQRDEAIVEATRLRETVAELVLRHRTTEVARLQLERDDAGAGVAVLDALRASLIEERDCFARDLAAVEADLATVRAQKTAIARELQTALTERAGLLADLALVRTPHEGVWRWQDDGGNHLESLSCPVVMSAERLRTLLREHPQHPQGYELVAAGVPVGTTAPARAIHVVMEGETPASIAMRYVGNGHRYQELLHDNLMADLGPYKLLKTGARLVLPASWVSSPPATLMAPVAPGGAVLPVTASQFPQRPPDAPYDVERLAWILAGIVRAASGWQDVKKTLGRTPGDIVYGVTKEQSWPRPDDMMRKAAARILQHVAPVMATAGPLQQPIECSTCNGSGEADNIAGTCPACMGLGRTLPEGRTLCPADVTDRSAEHEQHRCCLPLGHKGSYHEAWSWTHADGSPRPYPVLMAAWS